MKTQDRFKFDWEAYRAWHKRQNRIMIGLAVICGLILLFIVIAK